MKENILYYSENDEVCQIKCIIEGKTYAKMGILKSKDFKHNFIVRQKIVKAGMYTINQDTNDILWNDEPLITPSNINESIVIKLNNDREGNQ